jgi:hypothetical protein
MLSLQIRTRMQSAFYRDFSQQGDEVFTFCVPGTETEVTYAKYWSWEELKFVIHSVFRPLSVKDRHLSKKGKRGIDARVMSRDACIQAWSADINPSIIARLFEVVSPKRPEFAKMKQILPYLCVITRGEKWERMQLTMLLMDRYLGFGVVQCEGHFSTLVVVALPVLSFCHLYTFANGQYTSLTDQVSCTLSSVLSSSSNNNKIITETDVISTLRAIWVCECFV